VPRKIVLIAGAAMFLLGTSPQPEHLRQFLSPDEQLRATVTDVKNSPTGSEESRLTIQTVNGQILFDHSFESKDGEHGAGVLRAAWTPDSQYFVVSLSSSGGHQAWHFQTDFWRRRDAELLYLDDYLGSITDPDFSLKEPDVVITRGRNIESLEEETFRVSLASLGTQKGPELNGICLETLADWKGDLYEELGQRLGLAYRRKFPYRVFLLTKDADEDEACKAVNGHTIIATLRLPGVPGDQEVAVSDDCYDPTGKILKRQPVIGIFKKSNDQVVPTPAERAWLVDRETKSFQPIANAACESFQ